MLHVDRIFGKRGTHRISHYCVGYLSDARDGLPLLEELEHLGEGHGVRGLVLLGLARGGGLLVDEEIVLGGGLLPGEGGAALCGGVLRPAVTVPSEVRVGQDVGGLVVRVL